MNFDLDSNSIQRVQQDIFSGTDGYRTASTITIGEQLVATPIEPVPRTIEPVVIPRTTTTTTESETTSPPQTPQSNGLTSIPRSVSPTPSTNTTPSVEEPVAQPENQMPYYGGGYGGGGETQRTSEDEGETIEATPVINTKIFGVERKYFYGGLVLLAAFGYYYFNK